MKAKVKCFVFCLIFILIAGSTTVYAKSQSQIEPNVIVQCPYYSNGIHIGQPVEALCKIWDATSSPIHLLYTYDSFFFTKYQCQCGASVYIDTCGLSDIGHYFFGSALQYIEEDWVYYSAVNPQNVYYTDSEITSWFLNIPNYIIKK